MPCSGLKEASERIDSVAVLSVSREAALAFAKRRLSEAGVSWWSLFDGLLVLASVIMIVIGGRGYAKALRQLKRYRRDVEASGLAP